MSKTKEITPEVIKARMIQAEEMSQIWEKSPEAIQMYLRGCIVTAAALAGVKGLHEPQKAG